MILSPGVRPEGGPSLRPPANRFSAAVEYDFDPIGEAARRCYLANGAHAASRRIKRRRPGIDGRPRSLRGARLFGEHRTTVDPGGTAEDGAVPLNKCAPFCVSLPGVPPVPPLPRQTQDRVVEGAGIR